MVDIFDEIEEDLRAERAGRLFKQYAWLIVAAAVVILGSVAGWQLWNHRNSQQDTVAAAQYIAVQTALTQPNASAAAQLPTLAKLAATAPEGYKTIARLSAAGIKAGAGDLPGAIALWNSVAADPGASPLLRDFASLMVTERELDYGDLAQLRARLQPLAEPDNPWSTLAQEQLAMLDLRQGKVDEARKKLNALSIDIDAPAGLHARASALLTGLASQDSK